MQQEIQQERFTEKFAEEVARRLRQLFANSKLGMQIPVVERHRLEGFMQAGIYLGINSKTELAQLMEEIHIEVFGKTIAEHKAEAPNAWVFEEIDYRQFDTPAYERNQ
ncbi:hypothetical protein Mag101_01815 [Microbulbifer agarilyticus]|uniref:Uncharacterized protein n=1 Tax=Microbulbifer agarilyticus TaxID=260552 RepID=A0A1Q2M2R4_9GAMM|nr:hypothetical protein [Microbulbifer agarilyticus]AQQ66522.1 hypothetical protein Mag101_01815 [Microbulbifer agarilyticus]